MKFKNSLLKILLFILLPVFVLIFGTFLEINNPGSAVDHAFAGYASCPNNYSDDECLEYLRKQAEDVTSKIGNLQDLLDQEEYAQLGLYEKISYKQNLIAQKEAEITELEIEIEKNNVEIRILLREIETTQNEIDIASQEINKLEDDLESRVKISYKYVQMSPIEIFLNSTDFESLSRRIKYLQKTREKDVELLESMGDEIAKLNHEQQLLAQKKLDVQTKRNGIEEQKSELYSEKISLSSEQSQLQALLNESKQKEQEYIASLDANRIAQSALDEQISKLLASMIKEDVFDSGSYVPAGGTIGYMGSTGCSTGRHLHFSINGGTLYPYWGYFWGDISPWSGYLTKGPDSWGTSGGWTYYYIHSNNYVLPAQAPIVLTQNYHQGYSIDLASFRSTNVPIYAAHSGILVKGVEGVCGGKYAMIKGNDGNITIYLHIQ